MSHPYLLNLIYATRERARVSVDGAEKVKSVLAVGAHPDDIELGCAGALAKHK